MTITPNGGLDPGPNDDHESNYWAVLARAQLDANVKDRFGINAASTLLGTIPAEAFKYTVADVLDGLTKGLTGDLWKKSG